MASLLGMGVPAVVPRETSIEFDLVVSLRHCGDESRFVDAGLAEGEGVGPDVPAAGVLEKKPRMLCCLPVDGAWLVFFAVDGVFAGVRAVAAFSPILLPVTLPG